MNNSRLVKISKYLSFVLRHHPEKIGIKLDPHGWVAIEELLIAAKHDNFPIWETELYTVVEKNDKKRFSLDSSGTLIRANQGHSVEVDLQLEPQIPPDILYHGTGSHAIDSIKKTGLQKMSRHHVHLSNDVNKAINVAKRRSGKPMILVVDAMAMSQDSYHFYLSANHVWLVDEVPPRYLQISSILRREKRLF
ncbi:MAG: RNA 2'-phosphotransferase [Okeania sp. SIO3I5]|uniref:RNA 2'-phosphotransferase n=1 Tax=Okeania sp. SIO3I5 TaxID=2607805 RepID=UPI0013B92270|nr:RNA 2'-phosphotransferase [Okeania sp. SIO3I5]NEQ37468.1 RNA 2'-phosphotransferase [Okeania sp. SIO3I5]